MILTDKAAKRIGGWLISVVIAIVVIGMATMVDAEPITNLQKKQAVIVFLSLLGIIILVLIMMKHSIEMNTLFVLRLKDQLLRAGTSIDSLEKATKDNTTKTEALKGALHVVNNNLVHTAERIQALKEVIITDNTAKGKQQTIIPDQKYKK